MQYDYRKITIREMCYEDITLICEADRDESESNVSYLRRQLDNQKKGNCNCFDGRC